jgi:dipeptidyl aminopeptidase/acylaminoacyl peptidase
VDLIAFPGDNMTWDIRPDGSTIVTAVNTYCGSGACDQQAMRLAVIDMRAGVARWLTAADETRSVGNPLWSPDGSFVYYGAAEAAASVDLGIYRIRADGTDATRITDPALPAPAGLPARPFSSSRPQRVATDGLLFWSAFAGEKGALKVRDLATGIDRAFVGDEPCPGVVAWRAAPPGALVAPGGCHTPASKLVLWDLRTGAQTLLVDRSGIGAVYDADWDPAATRVVAAVAGGNPEGLAFADGRGGLTPIEDTQGAFAVRWLASGIAYTAFGDPRVSPPPDCPFGISTIRFLSGAAGPPRTLYSGCGIGVWHAVNP